MTFRGGLAITGTFILLLLTAVYGQNNDTAVRLGDNAALACNGVPYDGLNKHWEKNPTIPVKYLVAIQTQLGQSSPGAPYYDTDNIEAAGLTGRFTVTDDLMTATITAVRESDDGDFRCASGPTEILHRLITYKLTAVTTEPAGVATGYIGGMFEVRCSADSKPAPSFNWTKQGDSSIMTSGATLRISSLTVNDTGTYVCTAYHQYASGTASVQLTVSEEPTTTPTSPQGQTGDTNRNPTDPQTGAPLGTGAIVGIVIGVIAALALTAALVYFLLIREKKSGKGKEDGVESGDADVTYHATGHPGAPENLSRPPPNQPEVMYAELDLEKQPAGSRRPYVATPDDPPTEYASIRPNKPPRSSVPHTLAPDEKSEYASVSKPGTRY